MTAFRWRHFLAAALALMAGAAAAHSFTQPYTLPVPFVMYAWGAATALILSFIVVGLFAAVPVLASQRPAQPALPQAHGQGGKGWFAARAASLGLLLLCIASGLIGTRNPYANFNMTFFWIVFVLAVPYAVALAGDFYAAVNPWQVLVRCLESTTRLRFEGRRPYPRALGYYPALVLYIAFIWLELFGRVGPQGLSVALLVYTTINLVGAWVFGQRAWFQHVEFFGVFLRLLGRLSPRAVPWQPDGAPSTASRRRWRMPFSGLLEDRADHPGLVLFILFMLSSTAFDGLHGTLPWVTVFWKGIYPAIAPLLPAPPGQVYAVSAQAYHLWQWLSLLVSPVVYFVVFFAFVALARRFTQSTHDVGTLVGYFAYSLVPIAFVYHLTHYYTLLLAQGGQIVRLVSDPFGWGWNLFGTARWTIDPWVIDVGVIWQTQVVLIVLGHIVSVYVAHVQALQVFGSPRRAAVSQLPMLVLMVLFTTSGLWILSLPLSPTG